VSLSTQFEGMLADLGHPRVAIVGDVIMDRYVIGEVSRISPEAPIPILGARTSELRLPGDSISSAPQPARAARIAAVVIHFTDFIFSSPGVLLFSGRQVSYGKIAILFPSRIHIPFTVTFEFAD
jgi:hypothetical protein